MATDPTSLKQQASTTVSFGGTPFYPQIKQHPEHVVFEMDDRLDSEQDTAGVMRIRKYPPPTGSSPGFGSENPLHVASISYSVTQGSIYETTEVREKSVFGRLTFTGQDRIRLPYPISSGFSLSVVGNYYTPQGGQIFPSFSVDADVSEVVSNKIVIGAVDYEYKSLYRVLRYYPGLFLGVEDRFIWNKKTYGTLVARFNKAHIPAVLFQIQPPEALNIEYELYTLESTVIVNEDGVWERPTDWPTVGTYEGITSVRPDLQLDPNAPSLELTRIHEIATFTLQDFEERIKDTGSEQLQNLPTIYRNAATDKAKADKVADTLDTSTILAFADRLNPRSDSFYRGINDFPQPRMRITRYDRKIEQPFNSDVVNPGNGQKVHTGVSYHNLDRVVVVIDPNGVEQIIGPYLITITAVRARAPDSQSSIAETSKTRGVNNRENASDDLQAAITNNHLYKAWTAIDWVAIRRAIQKQYPAKWYNLNLDELIP